MKILLDTNILTRIVNPASGSHAELATSSIEKLNRAAHSLCLVPQNLYEFWAVATRPRDVNGLGMTTPEARAEVDEILSLFSFLHDTRSIFSHWLRLVTAYGTAGKVSHDARIVAAMVQHEVTHLLTFNRTDFAAFDEITTITPEQVVLSELR